MVASLVTVVIVGTQLANPTEGATPTVLGGARADARAVRLMTATPAPIPTPTPSTTTTTTVPPNCHPSYPTVCIPPPPPDLDCGDIPFRRFPVVGDDPHRFDGNNDGVGCES